MNAFKRVAAAAIAFATMAACLAGCGDKAENSGTGEKTGEFFIGSTGPVTLHLTVSPFREAHSLLLMKSTKQAVLTATSSNLR